MHPIHNTDTTAVSPWKINTIITSSFLCGNITHEENESMWWITNKKIQYACEIGLSKYPKGASLALNLNHLLCTFSANYSSIGSNQKKAGGSKEISQQHLIRIKGNNLKMLFSFTGRGKGSSLKHDIISPGNEWRWICWFFKDIWCD